MASNQPSTRPPSPAGDQIHKGSIGYDARRAPVRGTLEAVAPAPVVRAAAVESAAADAGTTGPASAAGVKRAWTAPTVRRPDIAEASFGPPPPVAETVVGTDERVQITATNLYPFRAIASLSIVAADNSAWIGTGWFISPRTLVTAGHCVFINSPQLPARHGWVKSISVMPGRDGASLPFGAVTSTDFRSSQGWTMDADPNFDYAAVILPAPLGDQTGAFGFGVYPDDKLRGADANIAGYPGDQPVGTMWYDAKKVIQVSGTKVFYDVDTAGGQSGAAVYRIVDGQTVAIAIHAYGVGGGTQSNSGTRITQEVYDNLLAWK